MISLSKLQCANFSGVNPSKFESKNFMAQFNNCNNSINSNKAKLRPTPLTLGENYEAAVSLLKK